MSPLLAIRGLESTTPEFRQELCNVAHRLELDASYMAAVMCVETGGSFSPSIRNPYTGAVGLIQFMPATCLAYCKHRFGGWQYPNAIDMAQRTASGFVESLSAREQLHAVEWYFERCGALARIRRHVPGDYYMAVFMPAHVGKPADHILFLEHEKGYLQNSGLDRNKDGKITVGDVWVTIDNVVADAVKRGVLGV